LSYVKNNLQVIGLLIAFLTSKGPLLIAGFFVILLKRNMLVVNSRRKVANYDYQAELLKNKRKRNSWRRSGHAF
jgi:hypothetical protein